MIHKLLMTMHWLIVICSSSVAFRGLVPMIYLKSSWDFPSCRTDGGFAERHRPWRWQLEVFSAGRSGWRGAPAHDPQHVWSARRPGTTLRPWGEVFNCLPATNIPTPPPTVISSWYSRYRQGNERYTSKGFVGTLMLVAWPSPPV